MLLHSKFFQVITRFLIKKKFYNAFTRHFIHQIFKFSLGTVDHLVVGIRYIAKNLISLEKTEKCCPAKMQFQYRISAQKLHPKMFDRKIGQHEISHIFIYRESIINKIYIKMINFFLSFLLEVLFHLNTSFSLISYMKKKVSLFLFLFNILCFLY